MIVRTKLLVSAIALMGMLPSGASIAGSVSGMDLIGMCNPAGIDPVYRLKVSQCRGYVVGVADTFDCQNPTRGFDWDSTTNTSQSDLVDFVIKWIGNHPQWMSHQANGLVAAALSEAFPCPVQESSKQPFK